MNPTVGPFICIFTLARDGYYAESKVDVLDQYLRCLTDPPAKIEVARHKRLIAMGS